MATGKTANILGHLQVLHAERLRELVDYDPATGTFTSRVTRGRCDRWSAGRRIGSVMKNGYCTISLDCRRYYAHRLAWLYVHGEWPQEEIDHINLNRLDNRITNLRLASRADNARNSPKRARNTSGFKGVTAHGDGRWRAQVMFNGKQNYLGAFQTREDAHAAYIRAARRLHGEFYSTGE